MGSLNETYQSRPQFFIKNITSAANAGQVAVGDVKVDSIALTSVVLRSNGATTADFTSAVVSAGPNGAETRLTLIPSSDATLTNLNNNGEQVGQSFGGALILKKDEEIVITLSGTGATAVDFTVFIGFTAVGEGGGII